MKIIQRCMEQEHYATVEIICRDVLDTITKEEVTGEVAVDVDNSAHKAENVHRNVDKVNMSKKHVHKSDKSIHEREWVGLTYKDITRLQDEYITEWGAYTVDFIEAIEAKLKEKNT